MQVERVRVLIGPLPGMLSDILASALGDDRALDVRVSREGEALLPSIGRVHPHVVIASCGHSALACLAAPLHLYLLGDDARSARCIEVRAAGDVMHDVSLGELVASLKATWAH